MNSNKKTNQTDDDKLSLKTNLDGDPIILDAYVCLVLLTSTTMNRVNSFVAVLQQP